MDKKQFYRKIAKFIEDSEQTKQANAAFLNDSATRKVVRSLYDSGLKRFKTFGGVTGGLLGSGIGGTKGLVETIKAQNDGELEDMSLKQKIKEYAKRTLKPAAIGLGVGVPTGIAGGALFKNHLMGKYMDAFEHDLKRTKLKARNMFPNDNKKIQDAIARAEMLRLVHENFEPLDLMKKVYKVGADQSTKLVLEQDKKMNQIYTPTTSAKLSDRRRKNNPKSKALNTPGLKLANYLI